jgi:hypothetical protein
MPASCLVDIALEKYASEQGWRPPPNRILGYRALRKASAVAKE